MANKAKDLASGTLSSSISASSTSISVSCGSGSDLALLAVWPTPPFYITVMPANPSASVPNSLDSEIMKVSVLNANDGIVNMSVSRGQRGTTAKAFSAGDIITNASYAEDAVLLGEESSSETPSPWIETGDIKDNQITSAKIDWTTFNYMPGDTLTINDDNFNLSGRLWISGSNKYALCALPLDKKIDSSVASITFTQTNYLNIYGGSSLVFSQNTSSSIVWTVAKSATVSNTLLFRIQLPSATNITTNTCCSLDFKGTITFA